MVRVYGCDGGRNVTGAFHDDSWIPGGCRCLTTGNETDIIAIFYDYASRSTFVCFMLLEHASDRIQNLFWHPSR